jgi:adenylate cyclase, class 2
VATEVELKAWVDDPDAVRARLGKLYRFDSATCKHDTYFAGPPGASIEEFRIREVAGQSVCTFKSKTLANGIEVNDEREFVVSDAAAFQSLLIRLGCSVTVRKVKHSEVYEADGANLELNHVEGLGVFLEIEALVHTTDAAAVREAQRRIRQLLAEAGIPESKIESRYYTHMLREQQGR